MTHFVDLEDKDGQVVDRHYYCSDFCASTDPEYQGWDGANELFSNECCGNCYKPLVWYDEEEKTYKVGVEAVESKHAGYWSRLGTTYHCYTCGAYCENENEE